MHNIYQHNNHGNSTARNWNDTAQPGNVSRKIFLLGCIKTNIPLGKGAKNNQYHKPNYRVDKNVGTAYYFNDLFHWLLFSSFIDKQKILKSSSNSNIPSALAFSLMNSVVDFSGTINVRKADSFFSRLISLNN